MRKISDDEFFNLIQGQDEERNLEFKPDFCCDEEESKKIKDETIRAVIAMANTPGGGDIILGVEHTNGKKPEFKGVSEKNWRNYFNSCEMIKKDVHRLCFGSPEFEIVYAKVKFKESERERFFVIFKVSEFSCYPILTKFQGNYSEVKEKRIYVINQDVLYIRSKGAQWSSKQASWEEFREAIKLTSDKYRAELKRRGYIRKEFDLDKYFEKEREEDE